MTNFGCFVYMADACNYQGDKANLFGAQNVANFNALPGYGGQKWDDRVASIVTGDLTWAELYSQIDYKGDVLRLGPNSAVRDLKDFSGRDGDFHNALSSMKIFDQRPANWKNSTEDKRGTVMSDLHRASVNRKVKGAVTDAIDLIPKVGSVLAPIVSFIWPAGADKSEVWEDMQVWISDLLYDLVAAVKDDINETLIRGLANLVIDCDSGPNEYNFTALYSTIRTYEPHFTKQSNAAPNLVYLTIFGTIALAVYRTAYFDYDSIYSHKSDPDREQKRKNLVDGIRKFGDVVKVGVATARSKRLADVTVEKGQSAFSFWYEATDRYTGWRTGHVDYNPGDHRGNHTEKHVKQAVENDAIHFTETCAAPTFDSEFDGYLETADVWSYFDVPGAPGQSLKRQRKVLPMGAWGRPLSPPSDGKGKQKDFSIVADAGKRLTRVTLYGGQYVDGIEVEIDGKLVDKEGKTGDKKQDKCVIEIKQGQAVVAAFGAWGKLVDHCSLRVQGFDAAGEPSGYPVDSGLGHSTGGLPFASSGADGSDATLVGFYGQVNSDGYLAALGFYWAYDRIQPRQ